MFSPNHQEFMLTQGLPAENRLTVRNFATPACGGWVRGTDGRIGCFEGIASRSSAQLTLRTSMTYPNHYLRENDKFPMVAGWALSYGFDAAGQLDRQTTTQRGAPVVDIEYRIAAANANFGLASQDDVENRPHGYW